MPRSLVHALLLLVALPPRAAVGQEPPRIAFGETDELAARGPLPSDLVLEPFTADERSWLTRAVGEVIAEAREVLPDLPDTVDVSFLKVSRDLEAVGGVTGRADAPGELVVELSVGYEGGMEAWLPGLRHTLFHESHHLVRGWTIRENRFGPGIGIAAINEGLAEVFAETQTGHVLPASEYPAEVRGWVEEILALPPDADYGTWMFAHPDGRLAIGYRTGRFVIHEAMARSGMTILELSELSPDRIIELAGLR